MSHEKDYAELSDLANKLKAFFWKEVRLRLKHPNASVQAPLTCSLTLPSTLRFFAAWWSLSRLLRKGTTEFGGNLDRMKSAAEELSSNMDSYDSGDRCSDTYTAFVFLAKINEMSVLAKNN